MIDVCDQMALAFLLADGDGPFGQDDVDSVKTGLRVALIPVEQTLADAQAEIARLRGALEKYEAVREDMFGHFCSNGLFNAWGKEFDCSCLNDAHLMAEAALKK